jgi:hypothetical protein
VAKPSKEAPKPITGLLMEKFTAFPAVNQSTGNSSQLQLMKPSTKALVILMLINQFQKLDPASQMPQRVPRAGALFMTTKPFTGSFEFSSPINWENSFGQVALSKNSKSTMTINIKSEGTGYVLWEIDDLEIEEGIGLRFQGNELTDYDGVFELPTELIKFLSDQGFNMSWAE